MLTGTLEIIHVRSETYPQRCYFVIIVKEFVGEVVVAHAFEVLVKVLISEHSERFRVQAGRDGEEIRPGYGWENVVHEGGANPRLG